MADGRRSDGHDTELLRAVFVILSGVLAFSVGVLLFWELRRIVALVVIAAFFATILNPMVDALTRLRMLRRSLREEMRAMRALPSLPATEVARTRWSPN